MSSLTASLRSTALIRLSALRRKSLLLQPKLCLQDGAPDQTGVQGVDAQRVGLRGVHTYKCGKEAHNASWAGSMANQQTALLFQQKPVFQPSSLPTSTSQPQQTIH